jgi:hypothetical protein
MLPVLHEVDRMIESKIIENDVVVAVDLIDLDAGTVTRQVDGKTVSTRPVTAEDMTLFGPPQPSAEDRLNTLLTALASATSLADVRAAAEAAAST